jgi:diaminopimelate decarboxylase
MNAFHYQNNELFIEDISLTSIAEKYGTPCYVYSRASIEKKWHLFNDSFGTTPHRICYAVKANSNIAILNLLAKLQSGFDIVSQGELERVLIAGGDPKKIIFSGVGKQSAEILRALEVGIFCFNVESEAELKRLNELAAEKNTIANIALRLNPNIDAGTHPYIATGLSDNKFGIELSEALPLCHRIQSMPNLKLIGIGCHIGSQLTDLKPFEEALDCLLQLIDQLALQKITLDYLDIGGGLGIRYQNENPPSISNYISIIQKKLKNHSFEIILEPGRAIIADAGILLTKVEYLKHTSHKNFAIVDAAMNDLMRPALYEAWQNIIPVKTNNQTTQIQYDIVGPVCESADFLGKNRLLALEIGDLLAICNAGAYGFSMSSNYNSRPRVAEIVVDGNQMHLIRRRESIQDLFAHEKII